MNWKENKHCRELKLMRKVLRFNCLGVSLLESFGTGGCREFKEILSVFVRRCENLLDENK